MEAVGFEEYLAALLHAPRPRTGALAFYDHRVGRICTDQRLLFLPLDDHLCLRGDGLFESLACRERVIFALDDHLARLREGAEALRLEPPCSWDELRARIVDVARAAGRDDCGMRVLLGRGPGGFGIAPSECPVSSLYIIALESSPTRPEVLEKGLSAFASTIPPKQPYLARIKSNNYLPNVLMAREAAERGLDVAVAFDEQGRMCEAAIASVGIVDAGGSLVCPPPERILAGTSMRAALAAAQARDMTVLRRDITRNDIAHAREMLLFTSASLCLSLTSFDGAPVGDGRPGPVASRLREDVLRIMLSEGTSF